MSVFRHPHLTRGIVTTSKGSFVIIRGLVEAPDEIGESLGWRPVHLENQPQATPASPLSRELTPPASDARASSRSSSRSSSRRNTEREARARLIRGKAAKLRSRSRVHMQPNE